MTAASHGSIVAGMGRAPIFKRAMTPAERQRRRRRRLRAERKAAALAEKRAKNAARLKASEPQRRAAFLEWEANLPPSVPSLENRAEEIAWQVDEAVALDPEITIEDVIAALYRRLKREPPD